MNTVMRDVKEGRGNPSKIGWLVVSWAFLGLVGWASGVLQALTPPTPEQMAQYQRDGTLAERRARALRLGNHRADPYRIWSFRQRLENLARKARGEPPINRPSAPPPNWQEGLPATGTVRVVVLLVDFDDYPHDSSQTPEDVEAKFFADGDSGDAPYESLRNFYQRSSYGQLTIEGNVLGWYRAKNDRDHYKDLGDGKGQETLMMEAINYFDAQGHDFAQYDNDGNGTLDALFCKWTGPDDGWSGFWWAYQWVWWATPSFTVDGKKPDHYVWSWYSNPDGGVYHPQTDIHETGHLLGLPDYYDYDETQGPDGGVGGLDMMDAVWGDHNCFSKFMLEWLTPTVIASGSQTLTLSPSGTSQDAVLIMPESTGGAPEATGDLFEEYFMAQYRRRNDGNDPGDYPTDGLLIWHVDSTLDSTGDDFEYDNSYTEHKLLRLMEADGLEEIESGGWADAGDYYTPPDEFGPETTPNSQNYAGEDTDVQVDELTAPGATMGARFSIGEPETPWQPDLWIKQGKKWKGKDLYNETGTGQRGSRVVATGATAVYKACLENDGNQVDSFWIQGPAGSSNWIVRYYQGTQVHPDYEVTSMVVSSSGWKRADIPPGGTERFLITVTAGPSSRARLEFLVQAKSDHDPNALDCLKLETRVPVVQPDLWIKQGPTWLGDEIMNGDGDEQIGQRLVEAGAAVKYYVRMYNDGGETATYFLTGPAGNGNWKVRYFKGKGYTKEITAQVTSGKGWKWVRVPPGEVRKFMIQVKAKSGVASGKKYRALVRVEAKLDSSQRDAVKTVTEVK